MTLSFILDTDTVSYSLRGQGRVRETILEHSPSSLCISAITAAELWYGANRRKSAKVHALIDTFVSTVAVVPFDDDCAIEYGRIATELAERGTPIGDLDVLIAAQSVHLRLTLVTNNVKHFNRVRGLKVVNWL